MRDLPRAASAVQDRLFSAASVVRIVVLVNAVGLNIYRRDNFDHQRAAVVCMVVMVGWTAFAHWFYSRTGQRSAWLLVADLSLALGLMLVTPWVKGADFRATVPGFWVSGALLMWAVRFGWRGGLSAGLVLAVADIVPRQVVRQSDYSNAFLLVLAGTVVGYLCQSLQKMAVERESAERAAAVAAERARLARAVHDGVLQVLSLMQRRGRELGGDLADLGRLAGEQERDLRRLIRTQDSVPPSSDVVDVVALLGVLEQDPNVTLATPGRPVELNETIAVEVVAAVRACVDNVRRHVGQQAPVWILLQDHGSHVELSVRDEGSGIAPGRLEKAATEGRLGVAESIRGRAEALGGTATVTTGPSGTQWQIIAPRMLGQAKVGI